LKTTLLRNKKEGHSKRKGGNRGKKKRDTACYSMTRVEDPKRHKKKGAFRTRYERGFLQKRKKLSEK